MTTKPKLLPCPFCGSEPEMHYQIDDLKDWKVLCECGACTCPVEIRRTEESAEADWNTRIAPAWHDAQNCDDSATARQAERHAQEIAAYELTVSNLRAQLAAWGAPVVWRHDMGEENWGWEYFESASCSECQPLYAAPQPAEQLLLAEKERDAIAELNCAQWIALENVRLLAARHRKEEWAQHMLRFCDDAGVRAHAIHRAQTQPAAHAQPSNDNAP